MLAAQLHMSDYLLRYVAQVMGMNENIYESSSASYEKSWKTTPQIQNIC